MFATTWIRRWFARYSPRRTPLVRRRRTKPSIRPALEGLEDRFAPAILTVNTLADGTSDTSHLDLREALTLVNNGGNPNSLGQPSMPSSWASQISGAFGNNDTIQFDPNLLTQNVGYGVGVIGLTSIGDTSVGPSALAINPGVNVTIAGPATGNTGITIERAASAAAMRLFLVASTNTSAGTLTLANLTLTGGEAVGGAGGRNTLGGGGGGAAGIGGAIFVEPGAMLDIQASTLTGNAAQGGNGGSVYNGSFPAPNLGGGGGGLDGAGESGRPLQNNGGGPNGGLGGYAGNSKAPGGMGGFGGGGGGGGYDYFVNYHKAHLNGQPGGQGGFGGGGGGGGGAVLLLSRFPLEQQTGGNGGYGGFGGGGGGGGDGPSNNGRYGIAGYGGGNGGSANNNGGGGGGGGAGMGGAVYNDGGTVILTNSTFASNAALGGAGGLSNSVNGHAGAGFGGAIFNDNGVLEVNYSTLDSNRADQGGGAIFSIAHAGGFASVSLGDSILADSVNGSFDFWGVNFGSTAAYIALAANLIQNNHGFAPPSGSPALLTGVSADLGPLGNNGGPTLTMAPRAGSPVINQGTSFLGNPFDQRGLPRVYNNNIDLGAVELNPATITVNTSNNASIDPKSLSLLQAIELADNTLTRDGLSTAQDNLVQGDPASGVTTIQFAASLAGQTISATSATDSAFGPTAFSVSNTNLKIAGLTGNQGVTIAGPGANGNLRLFRVAQGASLTLENLTLQGGNAVGNNGGNANKAGGGGGGSAGIGGAILNQGNLTLVNSTLTGNTATGGAGGQSNASFSAGGGAGGGGLQSSGSNNNGYYDGTRGGDPSGGYGAPSRFTPNGSPGGYGGGGGGGYGIYGTNGGQGGNGGLFGGGGGGGAGSVGGQGGTGGFGGGGGGGGNGFAGVPGGGGAGGYFGGRGGNDAIGGPGYAGGGGGGGAGLGGAIFNDLGNLTVVNSTFYADKAAGGAGGGGFYSGSAAQGIGGAVFNYFGNVTVTNSTLAGNTAQRGGAIFSDQSPLLIVPTVTLNNTILANSVGSVTDYDTNAPSDTFGSSGGNNLITNNAGFQGGILSSANPKLSTFGNHGGPTPTLEPLLGSPAVDTGNDAELSVIAQAEGVAPAKATDQTGNARILGKHIDVGAVEQPPLAASLKYLTKPVNTTAGQTMAPVQVEVLDQFGKLLATDNSDTITLSGPPFASGTTSATVVNGVATFNNLVIDKAGTYKLTASASNLTSTSCSFTITPAAVASIAFLIEPSNETAGKAITPAVKVELLDAFGNVATNHSATVKMTLANDPTGATLGGTTTVNTAKGVATFSNLIITVAGTGYTLKASEGSFTTTSTAFNVTAAPPAGVDIHGQPSDTVVGQAISPAVWVAVVDAYGNFVTSNNTQLVTLSIATGPDGATLGGTTTVRAHNGIATFSDLTLDLTGTYTLTATGGKLTPDFSNAFTVAPANISDDVKIQRGSLQPAGQPNTYEQTLTLTNTSGGSLAGPLAVMLTGLPSNVVLDDATGSYQGNPYVDFLPVDVSLGSGESLTLTLQFIFVGSGKHQLSYAAEVMEGI